MPFEFTLGLYVIYNQVGIYYIIAVALYAIFALSQRLRSLSEGPMLDQCNELKDRRMLHLAEAFNHAKNLKLYSWE